MQAYSYNQEFINAAGGSDVLIDVLQKKGMVGFINKHLGSRSARAEYSYGEGFLMWFVAVCRGAKRLENIYTHKESFLRHPRFNKFMSPDTFSYMCKELSVDNQYYKKKPKQAKDGVTELYVDEYNEANWNDKMAHLLVDTTLKLGLLKKNVKYTLDYDTTVIETKIRGSRKHYKGNGRTGYSPALASINNIPVAIENRNGDSNGSFNLTKTIARIINFLKKKGIIVNVVRVDGAGYSKEFVNYMCRKGIKFYTRAKATTTNGLVGDVFNWQTMYINKFKVQVGSTSFDFGNYKIRMVLEHKEDGTYWSVITNDDLAMSNKDVLLFYKKRGDSENVFKYLKYDFGWNIMPMRELNHNCVYLILQAFCYLLFTYITRTFSGVAKFVKRNWRLPTFTNEFMKVPTRWIGTELQFLDRFKDYILLSGFT